MHACACMAIESGERDPSSFLPHVSFSSSNCERRQDTISKEARNRRVLRNRVPSNVEGITDYLRISAKVTIPYFSLLSYDYTMTTNKQQTIGKRGFCESSITLESFKTSTSKDGSFSFCYTNCLSMGYFSITIDRRNNASPCLQLDLNKKIITDHLPTYTPQSYLSTLYLVWALSQIQRKQDRIFFSSFILSPEGESRLNLWGRRPRTLVSLLCSFLFR